MSFPLRRSHFRRAQLFARALMMLMATWLITLWPTSTVALAHDFLVTNAQNPAEADAVPVAIDDQAQTTTSVPVVIPVLSNDTDADGDALTITLVSDPANGSVVNNGGASIVYSPVAGFVGSDTFSYTISDGNGGTDSALVTVTVNSPVPTGLPEEQQPGQEFRIFLPGLGR